MKIKFWCIGVLILLIGAQRANCNEHRAVWANMNEQEKTSNRCTRLQTDATFFRAYGTGIARHQNTAKIKAQMDANPKLLVVVQTWIKEFLSKYLDEIGQSSEEYRQAFDEKDKDVIEEEIFKGAIVACNGVNNIESDGLYEIYLTIEVKRKNVFEVLNKVLGADKNWAGVYDRRKMETLFQSEIKKLKARK